MLICVAYEYNMIIYDLSQILYFTSVSLMKCNWHENLASLWYTETNRYFPVFLVNQKLIVVLIIENHILTLYCAYKIIIYEYFIFKQVLLVQNLECIFDNCSTHIHDA